MMLGAFGLLCAQSAFAVTLAEAQKAKEVCKDNRKIEVRYYGVLQMSLYNRVDNFEVMTLVENDKIVGAHYCSVKGYPSQIKLDGKEYQVSPPFCISALKIYHQDYQFCLEVNSLLNQEAAKTAATSEQKTIFEIKDLKLGQETMGEIPLLSGNDKVAGLYCSGRGMEAQILIEGKSFKLNDCNDILKFADKSLRIVVDPMTESVQSITPLN
ncbi:hypothetical protein D3C87_161620 [compost metagenome]